MQAKRSPLFFSFCILGSVFISYLYSPVFKVLLTVDTSLQAENVIFFRMLIAAVFLWGVCLLRPGLRAQTIRVLHDRRMLLLLLSLGLCRGIDVLCWAFALEDTNGFVVNILGNSTPLFVMLASYVLFGERPKRSCVPGMLVCLCGLVLVALSSGTGGANACSVMIMTGSAMLYTSFLLIGRLVRRRDGTLSMYVVMAYTCLSSLLAVSPFCLFSGAPLGPFPFKAWGLIALLAFGATIIGQIVPIWAVRYVRPSTVSMLSLAGPLFSAVGCYWLLGEVPSAQVVCGGLVVLAGLAWYIGADAR